MKKYKLIYRSEQKENLSFTHINYKNLTRVINKLLEVVYNDKLGRKEYDYIYIDYITTSYIQILLVNKDDISNINNHEYRDNPLVKWFYSDYFKIITHYFFSPTMSDEMIRSTNTPSETFELFLNRLK